MDAANPAGVLEPTSSFGQLEYNPRNYGQAQSEERIIEAFPKEESLTQTTRKPNREAAERRRDAHRHSACPRRPGDASGSGAARASQPVTQRRGLPRLQSLPVH